MVVLSSTYSRAAILSAKAVVHAAQNVAAALEIAESDSSAYSHTQITDTQTHTTHAVACVAVPLDSISRIGDDDNLKPSSLNSLMSNHNHDSLLSLSPTRPTQHRPHAALALICVRSTHGGAAGTRHPAVVLCLRPTSDRLCHVSDPGLAHVPDAAPLPRPDYLFAAR